MWLRGVGGGGGVLDGALLVLLLTCRGTWGPTRERQGELMSIPLSEKTKYNKIYSVFGAVCEYGK